MKMKHTPGPWTAVTHKSGIKLSESGVRDESGAYTSAFGIVAPGRHEFVVSAGGLTKQPQKCLVIEPDKAKFCDPEGVFYGPEECDANARLIAAAPELLEAAQAVLKSASPTEKEHPRMFAAFQQLSAILAKATSAE